jgi:phosphate transport system substrate-binding protein
MDVTRMHGGSRAFWVAGMIALVVTALGVGTAAAAQASGEVKITGSSTVEPITSFVGELFAETNPDVSIRVDGPGTGDGFELFCSAEAGEWDATDASRAIEDEEAANCEQNNVNYTELTVGIDGLTIVANKASKISCLDHAQIYAIFGPESAGGDVNLSDAQALATELGSTNKALPSGKVTKFTPGPESGTYDSFIEINYADIMEERLAAGEIPSSRSGTNDDGEAEVTEPLVAKGTFPNDNNIVQRVEASKNGIGFFGFAYFQANKGELKDIAIYNADTGKCVRPTAKTIQNGTYKISRPLFVYVDNAKIAGGGAPKAFFDSYITEKTLTDTVLEAGYVPADKATRQATISAYKAIPAT